MKLILLGAAALFLASTSPAPGTVTVAGVSLPDQVLVDEAPLKLNGAGLHEATLFRVDVYVAGLYVEVPTSSAAQILDGSQTQQLVLKFKKDVSRKKLLRAARKGLEHQPQERLARLGPELEELFRCLPGVKRGDTLAFTYRKDQGVRVEHNGQRRGQIEGQQFARALFSAWLGEDPINEKLKRRLLGHL